MVSEYSSVKIKRSSHQVAKVRAAELGITMLEYFEYLFRMDKTLKQWNETGQGQPVFPDAPVTKKYFSNETS